jgi:transposase-like protein
MTDTKLDLRDPIFHDDDKAREHLETLLWPQGPVCPRCGVVGNRITKLQGVSTRPGVYKCKDCRKPFSVTVGTVMERSHIPLSKWVLAAQLMASSKKGMSALQLQRMLGTNYETAWFLFHRLREAAVDLDPGPLGGSGKIVEADEAFIGGLEKNKHRNKRKHVRGGAGGKQVVFSLIERDGYVRSRHVADEPRSRYARCWLRKPRATHTS